MSSTPATTTVLKSLNGAMHAMMEADERVLLIGEDLLDPYGGAFKVARGLSERFPERVLTTPISEAGFVGVAAGMAMRGLRPIVEIMFGDFLMLAADQLLNHISKYRWMYNDQVHVPMVIRAPMGARRGYGPTHSQSVEKHILGMPGLHVVAPSVLHDAGALLRTALLDDLSPVVFVENKLMYARRQLSAEGGRIGELYARSSSDRYPTTTVSWEPFDHADVTLVAYGGMVELAMEAAETLFFDEELVVEVVAPSSLQPLDLAPILDSLQRSGKLVVCEEGTAGAGFGAEVISRVSAEGFSLLKAAPKRVAARDYPIANTRSLEDMILPQVADLIRTCRA